MSLYKFEFEENMKCLTIYKEKNEFDNLIGIIININNEFYFISRAINSDNECLLIYLKDFFDIDLLFLNKYSSFDEFEGKIKIKNSYTMNCENFKSNINDDFINNIINFVSNHINKGD